MQKRITVFDTIRGFTMLSMAGFHTCYDLAYLYGWKMTWFTQTIFQDIWRASISWVFLFIAGWMCTLSRNNIKRAAKYAVAALIVWIATTLVSVDDSVNFGIIFCMAACTAIVALARPVLDRVPAVWGITICLILFACTWSIPKAVYPIPYLAWLGFPSPDFVSGDYYPLIPFYFMYLAGFFAARTPCTTVLSASSARYIGRTGADLFRSVTLKTWCDTGRQLCHNTNAALKIFLVQKGSLFVHERD